MKTFFKTDYQSEFLHHFNGGSLAVFLDFNFCNWKEETCLILCNADFYYLFFHSCTSFLFCSAFLHGSLMKPVMRASLSPSSRGSSALASRCWQSGVQQRRLGRLNRANEVVRGVQPLWLMGVPARQPMVGLRLWSAEHDGRPPRAASAGPRHSPQIKDLTL